jgi:hypothetical protein
MNFNEPVSVTSDLAALSISVVWGCEAPPNSGSFQSLERTIKITPGYA